MPVLRRIRVGQNLDRLNGFERQVNPKFAGNRIGDIGAIDREPTLAGPRAFRIKQTIGPADNSGDEWQRILEALAHEGQSLQFVLRQCRGRCCVCRV